MVAFRPCPKKTQYRSWGAKLWLDHPFFISPKYAIRFIPGVWWNGSFIMVKWEIVFLWSVLKFYVNIQRSVKLWWYFLRKFLAQRLNWVSTCITAYVQCLENIYQTLIPERIKGRRRTKPLQIKQKSYFLKLKVWYTGAQGFSVRN